jgi:outer membrane protein OmpA-like peptidoglycan-associated protein
MRLLLAAAVLAIALPASAAVVLIRPFPGSRPLAREQLASLALPEGPVAAGALSKAREVRGRTMRRTFKNPKDRSAADLAAFYQSELVAAGFEKLWECQGAACGAGKGPKPLFGAAPIGPDDRVITARLFRHELGDAFTAIHVAPGETVMITALTAATQEQKEQASKEAAAAASKVTAAALAEALAKDGRASLVDVLYRPGEVALRPEAAQTVQEIAKLLEQQPDLNLYVVGHTDDTGDLTRNFGLSRRRAEWLVAQLVKRGVARSRLRADGVGPLAPVATNRTEEGRGHNRRVELVAR